MGVLAASLLAGLVSFLPRGTRGWFAHDEELQRPALITGILQYVLCASILLTRFVLFMQANVGAVGASAVAQGNDIALERAQYDLGFAVSTEYLFRPTTVLLFYLMCEGLARFFAAAVTREVVGTAPLYLLARTCKGCARLYAGLARKRNSIVTVPRRTERNPNYSSVELRAAAPPPSNGNPKPT